MDFHLSQEQRIIQKEAIRFAQREVAPRAEEETFNPTIVEKMGELGFFGCAFPQQFGGSDSGFLTHLLVCEAIAKADSGLRPLFNLQGMTVPYTI